MSHADSINATAVRGAVPASYALVLDEYLTERGLDPAVLLDGVRPTADNGQRVSVSDWQQQLQRAAAALGEPTLGLQLGQRISPRHFGLLGYVLLACGDVGSALQRLQHYHRLIYDVNMLKVVNHNDQLRLIWGTEMGRPGALADETAIAALVQFCRELTGNSAIKPLAVKFVNPSPTNPEPYEQWFGCPVQFDQAETQVTLAAGLLDMPLRQPDPALIDLLEKQADDLLATLDSKPGSALATDVRQRISRLLRRGEPSAEQIAAQLCITSRTLHRRLAAENQSFRQLLQETRLHLARDYLNDPRLQLTEIALLLGYSEQSAFSRAFRQWQGVTPRHYRRQLSQAAD